MPQTAGAPPTGTGLVTDFLTGVLTAIILDALPFQFPDTPAADPAGYEEGPKAPAAEAVGRNGAAEHGQVHPADGVAPGGR